MDAEYIIHYGRPTLGGPSDDQSDQVTKDKIRWQESSPSSKSTRKGHRVDVSLLTVDAIILSLIGLINRFPFLHAVNVAGEAGIVQRNESVQKEMGTSHQER